MTRVTEPPAPVLPDTVDADLLATWSKAALVEFVRGHGSTRSKTSLGKETKPELIALALETVEAHEPAPPHDDPDEVEHFDQPAPDPSVGTDLEAVPVSQLPSFSKWQQMEAMADRFARSNLVPKALRGKAPDIQLIFLAAHDLGISATQGLQKIHVIDGKVTMSAELMSALILARGHELWAEELTATRAVVCGRRAGSDQTSRVEFTFEEAEAAGLVNRSRARDNRGKPIAGSGTYDKFPKSMLWARAVSQLARMAFADVLAGVTYTPEELGAVVNAAGDLEADGVEVAPTDPVTEDDRADIERRIAQLEPAHRKQLSEAWQAAMKEGRAVAIAKLVGSERGQLHAVVELLEAAEARQRQDAAAEAPQTEHDDAEVVGDSAAQFDAHAAEVAAQALDLNGAVVAAVKDGEWRCESCGEPATDNDPASEDHPTFHVSHAPFGNE